MRCIHYKFMIKQLIIIALLFCPIILSSQDVITNDIKVYQLEQDLTHNSVISFIQDSKGFMWIGTVNGLNRYNGVDIVSYKNDPKENTTISNNRVVQMAEDHKGNIWFATENGLSRYDRENDNFVQYHFSYNDETTISSEIVSSVMVDSKGRVWVGCDQLCLYNPNKDNFSRFRSFGEPPAKGINNLISFLFEDSNKDIWFIVPKELHKLNSKTLKLEMIYDGHKYPLSELDWGFYGMKEDNEGNYWISTDRAGIFKTKFKSTDRELELFKDFQGFNYKDILYSHVQQLIIIGDEIWFSVENKGIYVINNTGKLIKRFINDPADESSVAFNSIWALYADRNERIWMGTWESGVSILDPYYLKFKHYKYQPGVEGLSLNNVKKFVEDEKGNIWIATDGGGLNYFNRNDNTFTVYKHNPDDPTSIGSDAILDLALDDDGNVWAGTWNGGINVFKGEEEGFYKYNTENCPISSNHSFGILNGGDGKMYIASFFGGISIYNMENDTWELHNPDQENSDSLFSSFIFSINQDLNNDLWLSADDFFGVMKENENGENYFISYFHDSEDPTSISGNSICVTFEDNRNNFWVGTTSGLNLMNREDGTFESFTSRDGFPDDLINCIEGDNKGNLWIGSNKGLTRFNYEKNEITNFHISDGIQGLQFNRGASLVLSTGEILMGGTSGFNIFYPDSVKNNPYKPNVVFTDFKIYNNSVSIGPKSVLKRHVRETQSIKLSYKEAVFSFNFISLNLTHPEENQYAYIMEGFEEAWNYVGNTRSATYTNLNAGNYVFRVKASNNDGEWNKEGILINIKITPPFWKTWWFIVIVIGLIIYSVYYFIRQREKQAKQTKHILEVKVEEGEQRIQEKVDELEKQKEEIKERELLEQESRYMNKGLAEFSGIISSNRDNVQALANGILTKIISFVGVQQGIIFIHNQNPDEPRLEITGSYACNSEILDKKFFLDNEGYVGACYTDNVIKVIEDLPDGYINIESGLGSTRPKYLIDIPISFDVLKMGVLELASFKQIEEYKINFLKKLCENIASIISANLANENLKSMIEQNEQQTEELRSQEEEMRQNIEELMATQEEFQRKEAEHDKNILELKNKGKDYQSTIKKLKSEIRKK